MTDKRFDHEFENESEDEKSDVDRNAITRKRKARFQIGDEVQMDVIEHDRYDQEVRTSKIFFIHDCRYVERSNRWVYQLNEEDNGKPGAPYKEHQWIAERPLAPVL